MANMKRYYIANEAGRVEEMWFNNDNEAFTYAVERNKKKPAWRFDFRCSDLQINDGG